MQSLLTTAVVDPILAQDSDVAFIRRIEPRAFSRAELTNMRSPCLQQSSPTPSVSTTATPAPSSSAGSKQTPPPGSLQAFPTRATPASAYCASKTPVSRQREQHETVRVCNTPSGNTTPEAGSSSDGGSDDGSSKHSSDCGNSSSRHQREVQQVRSWTLSFFACAQPPGPITT